MTQYLISFGAHAMDHIADADMPAVANAARTVCREAIEADVYVMAGGLQDQPATVVDVDGTVTSGPRPDAIGGMMIIDVSSREQAQKWAAKVARACRCTQELQEIAFDPELAQIRGRIRRPASPDSRPSRGSAQ